MPKTKYFKQTIITLIAIIFIGAIYLHSKNECNVAVVPLTGTLVTTIDPTDKTDQQASSDVIDQQLEQANENPHIKAIVLSVNSPGGDPVAGEDIYKELKSINKPTVVSARSKDDSAAYEASLGGNTIFAPDVSPVGDIGVNASYTDNSVQDQQNGITYNQLSIGKYKNLGNTDKPLTVDEKTQEMNILQKQYDIFVNLVAENRHLSFATAQALANGGEYIGNDALQNGLIDHIGNMIEVKQYLTKMLGGKIKICNAQD